MNVSSMQFTLNVVSNKRYVAYFSDGKHFLLAHAAFKNNVTYINSRFV